MSKIYNIFISHSWNYSDDYEKIIEMLEKSSIEYKNYSVPKNDPIHNANNDTELYEAIKAQIKSTSVVIILAGVYSSYSKWIDKEIQIAKNDFNKKIIAIEPWASEKISVKVKSNADKIIGWNYTSLEKAIKELA
ncbi:MAG: TIR domain-containing protein [Fusobacteriaceae bacterium]